MAKGKGTSNMSEPDKNDPQIDPSKGAKAAGNEFAPTIVNDGGENGAREEMPAKLDEDKQAGDYAPEWQPPSEEEMVREFVQYVNGELQEVADRFGYDLKLTKRNRSNVGPVMLYDPATREGKVFESRDSAPENFLTGDELNELRAREAE